jgi:hypothetical protein
METALEALNQLKLAIGGGSDVSLIKEVRIDSRGKLKDGVIYVLSNEEDDKYYIGFEYEGNIENELKDLIVRSIAYDKMGYLYEASNEIFKNTPVKFEILEKVSVKTKYVLAEYALNHMLELGKDRCVNIWNPVDLISSKVKNVSLIWNNNKRVKEIEKYKSEKEEEMLKELLDEGYDLEYARMMMMEKRRETMIEIRKLKDYLYSEWIII